MIKVLYADPPWPQKDTTVKAGGTAAHYETMSLSDIKRFPFPAVDKDAWCFMWRLNSMMEEAFDVMRAWGFRPCSEVIWVKTTKHGKRHMGPGSVVRGEHETCLIGKRGNPVRKNKGVRSVLTAQVGIHSAKPDTMYDLIESIADGPYLELFSRVIRPGWERIGNQIRMDPTPDPRAPYWRD